MEITRAPLYCMSCAQHRPLEVDSHIAPLIYHRPLNTDRRKKLHWKKAALSTPKYALFHQIQQQLGQEISHLWPRAARLVLSEI